MTVVMVRDVLSTLLEYYKQLRTNPKYKIPWKRAWDKYSMFFNYVNSGILSDLQKGRFCKYRDMGQRYNKRGEPKFPTLKYLTYQDESKTKWYIAYICNTEDDVLTIVKIKMSTLVKCSAEKQNAILITERTLRRIISETIQRVLYN